MAGDGDERRHDRLGPDGFDTVGDAMSTILNVNIRSYPSELNPDHPPEITAVLVAGEIGDYACYVGHGSPEWVARFGDKMSFEQAVAQFSPLERHRYRL